MQFDWIPPAEQYIFWPGVFGNDEYEWDQFQATTAEKVGDVYYLYANTFKYYYSGDPRTPVKVWILNRRFQSSQILKENIAK